MKIVVDIEDIPQKIHENIRYIFNNIGKQIVLSRALPFNIFQTKFKMTQNEIYKYFKPLIDQKRADDTFFGWIIKYHCIRTQINENGLNEYLGDSNLVEEAKLIIETTDDIFDLATKLANRFNEKRLKFANIKCFNCPYDEKLILEESVGFCGAATESTITAIITGVYLLCQYRNIQNKLREYVELMKGPIPDQAELRNCKYIQNLFSEMLRLKPSSYLFNREAIQDTTIGNQLIKRGTTIWGCQLITQLHEKFWDDPNNFEPERFNNKYTVGSYFPFSLGARMCPGVKFANLETTFLLSTLVENFNVTF